MLADPEKKSNFCSGNISVECKMTTWQLFKFFLPLSLTEKLVMTHLTLACSICCEYISQTYPHITYKTSLMSQQLQTQNGTYFEVIFVKF